MMMFTFALSVCNLETLTPPFFKFREDYKFYSEMDEIFRRELKVDDSVADTEDTEEPEDCTQKKGETSQKHFHIV